MELNQWLQAVEATSTLEEAEALATRHSEAMGFASYCFIDTGSPHVLEPYHLNSDLEWAKIYIDGGFVEFDPVLSKARRTSVPFSWGSIELPGPRSPRLPGILRVMEASGAYGFTDGFVVPHHTVDRLGRPQSLLFSYFWTGSAEKFEALMREQRVNIHVFSFYWMERTRAIRSAASPSPDAPAQGYLTDREKDVMSWVARGKKDNEIAEILQIGTQTVQEHVRGARKRLDAENRAHAVAKALMCGSIDI